MIYWQWAAIILSFISASFWLAAATVKTPKELRDFLRQPLQGPLQGDFDDLVNGVRKQSTLNALGAGFLAIAIICQAIAFWLT